MILTTVIPLEQRVGTILQKVEDWMTSTKMEKADVDYSSEKSGWELGDIRKQLPGIYRLYLGADFWAYLLAKRS